MVIGYVPGGVDAEVAAVRVAEPPAGAELGVGVTLVPAGAPAAVSETVCALPEVTAVDTVADADEPGFTEPDVGDTATEKSFVGVVPPLVNGAKALLKNHWLCAMPEQESEPP